ncbi:MAG: DUF4330 family protein [Eubacteriales bacterium]|nr:DUF4330 family protein [Eubacteriales bacterium]
MKNKRFNLFDLLIIIILIGVVLGIVFRSQIKDTLFPGESAVLRVTLKVESMPNDCADSITEDTKLYIAQSGRYFGKVVSATFSPVKDTVFVGDQEVQAPSEYYSSAVIIMEISGYILEDTYYTKADDILLIKSEFGLETEDAYFRGKITEITVMKADDQQ